MVLFNFGSQKWGFYSSLIEEGSINFAPKERIIFHSLAKSMPFLLFNRELFPPLLFGAHAHLHSRFGHPGDGAEHLLLRVQVAAVHDGVRRRDAEDECDADARDALGCAGCGRAGVVWVTPRVPHGKPGYHF